MTSIYFFTGRCHSLTVVKKTVSKMGQIGHAKFIRLGDRVYDYIIHPSHLLETIWIDLRMNEVHKNCNISLHNFCVIALGCVGYRILVTYHRDHFTIISLYACLSQNLSKLLKYDWYNFIQTLQEWSYPGVILDINLQDWSEPQVLHIFNPYPANTESDEALPPV